MLALKNTMSNIVTRAYGKPMSTASKITKALAVATLLVLFPMQVQAMAFIDAAMGYLSTVVILIGAGLGIWGVVNLVEGYGNDNPGAKSQGMKHYMLI